MVRESESPRIESATEFSRRRVLTGLAQGVALGAAGWLSDVPQAALAQAAKRGGTLIIALDNNPPAMTILASTATLTNCTSGQFFNTLMEFTRDFKLVPSLAKDWAVTPDGKQVTLHLQSGVTWHDGTPFTSEDVRYSIFELNGKYNALARATYAGISDIATPDATTVVVTLKKADPAFFPWAFSQPELAHIHPKHIYEGTDPRTNPANMKPIGTGAFRFVEWQNGSHIILERFPNYFRKEEIFLDRIVFQIIPEPGARQLALERGDIDHIPYFCLPTESIEPLSANPAVKIIDTVRPARGEILMYVNVRNEFLGKKAVRQALAYTIDKQKLVDLVLNGRGKPATGPIRSDHQPFYNPNVAKYPRNITLANKMLDEAGVPRKSGGIRFSTRLSYQSSGEGGALQAAGEVMREEMKEIGVDLQLTPMDPTAVLQTAFVDWNFDMMMGSFFTGPDPKISVSPKYLGSNVKRLLGANLTGYANPAVDVLLNAADNEMDEAKRADLYKQAQVILVDDLPVIWLWEKTYPLAVRANLIGLPSGAMHWEPYEGVHWT